MKLWVTPSADIIADVPINEPIKAIRGEIIAQFLTDTGTPCRFVALDVSPQLLQYHFNLIDLLKENIKKSVKALERAEHIKVFENTSTCAHFSIMMPRESKQLLYFKNMLYYNEFINSGILSAFVGISSSNKLIILDFKKITHLLIAGTTGSGKSTLINTLLCSLLYKATPENIKIVLIDPKYTEFRAFENLPHLLTPIVKEVNEAINILIKLCNLMDQRYRELETIESKPHIIVIIDELADLMLTSGGTVENMLVRLAQKGRACKIHLIIATQNPIIKVLTSLIKANINNIIALKTQSIRASVTILDHKGAEQLTGSGDCLIKLYDKVEEIRTQTAYIKHSDILEIVEHWKKQA